MQECLLCFQAQSALSVKLARHESLEFGFCVGDGVGAVEIEVEGGVGSTLGGWAGAEQSFCPFLDVRPWEGGVFEV